MSWSQSRRYEGEDAAGPIMNRLSGRPQARAIAAEVISFYGDYLRYYESPTLSSSLYEIRLNHDPVGLNCARIDLQLGTDRTAEALTHELLHLRLGVLGYPMGEEVWIPTELVPHARHLLGMHAIVGNLLQHDLIFDDFLDLGFARNRFLSGPIPDPNYEALALVLKRSAGCPEELAFPWWCLEYLRHWLSLRHGGGEKSGLFARNALYWGAKTFPSMTAVAKEVSRIIESGTLRDPRQYPSVVNRLLGLMKLPKQTRWVGIEAAQEGGDMDNVVTMKCNPGILCRRPHSHERTRVSIAMTDTQPAQ